MVLADAGEPASLTLGASAAVALGVPLLRSAASSSTTPTVEPTIEPDNALGVEFERLGVTSVLAIGTEAARGVPANSDVQTVSLPSDSAAVAAAIGTALGPAEPLEPQGLAAAFAALDPSNPVALVPVGQESTYAGETAQADEPPLPRVQRPEAVTGTFVLASATPETLPGIATARAAGIAVQVVAPEQLDPRSSSEAITALSAAKPHAVIVMGAGYATEQGLDWNWRLQRAERSCPGAVSCSFSNACSWPSMAPPKAVPWVRSASRT